MMFGSFGVGQDRRSAASRGEDPDQFGAERDRDRYGRRVALRGQLYLFAVLGDRPAPRVVGSSSHEPIAVTFGPRCRVLRRSAQLVNDALAAGHPLAGRNSLDERQAHERTAHGAERTRLTPLPQRNQVHGAGGLAGHTGSVADQHHCLVRHNRRTGTWTPRPVGITHRATPMRGAEDAVVASATSQRLSTGSAGEIVEFAILGAG
jgi:hypothetical protein